MTHFSIGLEAGLDCLVHVKEELGVPIVTDVHETGHVNRVAQVADVIQIPSLLCRQTDLIQAAARSGRIVHLKKGQFASPSVMAHAVRKVHTAGNPYAMVCERGTSYGVSDLVLDPRQLVKLGTSCHGAPIVVDITHSCQSPPHGDANSSSGDRSMIPFIGRAAVSIGVDGIFIECHETPDNAPVDSAVQWPIDSLKPLLEELVALSKVPRFV